MFMWKLKLFITINSYRYMENHFNYLARCIN